MSSLSPCPKKLNLRICLAPYEKEEEEFENIN
jgi:hypothetical protein